MPAAAVAPTSPTEKDAGRRADSGRARNPVQSMACVSTLPLTAHQEQTDRQPKPPGSVATRKKSAGGKGKSGFQNCQLCR